MEMAGAAAASKLTAFRGLMVLLLAALLLFSCFAQTAVAAVDVPGSVRIFGPGRKLAGVADLVNGAVTSVVNEVGDLTGVTFPPIPEIPTPPLPEIPFPPLPEIPAPPLPGLAEPPLPGLAAPPLP